MAALPKQVIADLEDVLDITSDKTVYDFTPFLTAPAVQRLAAESANTPVVISIPTTKIPSPLAPDLGASEIKSLHDYLCGPGNGNNTKRQRGRETWLSWKRAWDLWNNHYIEGREAPEWIRDEYKTLKKEFEADREKKRLEQQNNMRFSRRKFPLVTHGPYRRKFDKTKPIDRPGRRYIATGYEEKVVKKKPGQRVRVASGEERLVEGPATNVLKVLPPSPPATDYPTKIYQAREPVPIILADVPVSEMRVEYVIAAPRGPDPKSYSRLVQERARNNIANRSKKERWFMRRKHAKDSGQVFREPEDWELTISPPADEDVVEDTSTFIQEKAVRRAVGAPTIEKVSTERFERGGLIPYAKLQRIRAGMGDPVLLPSKEDQVYPTRQKEVVRYDQLEHQVKIRSDGSTVWVQYPKAIEGFTANHTQRAAEKQYVQVAVGVMVDDLELDTIPEWREVDAPEPPPRRKKFASHAHSAPALGVKEKKHVTFESSPQPKTIKSGSIRTNLAEQGNLDWEDSSDNSYNPQNDIQESSSDEDDSGDSDTDPFGKALAYSSYDDSEEPFPFPDAKSVEHGPEEASGGFRPMKNLPDYAIPDTDEFGQYPPWEDRLLNTVWRPRRVGEKKLKIDIDEDIDDSKPTDLEVLGGVDCGRSPYPVLRPVTKYIKLRRSTTYDSVFAKRKDWDGVTGTIFNMPSKPIEEDSQPVDERRLRMKTLYGDYFRDERDQPRQDIFPLDIRRINRMDNRFKRNQTVDVAVDGEEVVFPWKTPVKSDDDLPETDPWYVTPEQEKLRDVPSRKYPPPDCANENDPDKGGKLLYTYDTNWKLEVENDDFYNSRYFVTNLHGGTLIINGVEVRKGCIAGPLPDFAVIECPGDQIAFWFGSGGRNWGRGRPGSNLATHWEHLRSMEGFQYIGLNAGQVWNTIIKDRLRRELTGNKLQDDEQWKEWKNYKTPPAPKSKNPMSFPEIELYVPDSFQPSNFTEPGCFHTELDELRWLKTRAEPLCIAAKRALGDTTITPTPENFWPILGNDPPPAPPEVELQRTAEKKFAIDRIRIVRAQRDATSAYVKALNIRKEGAERKRTQDLKRKREIRESFSQPPRQRTRTELDDASLAARDKHRQDLIQAMDDDRIWHQYLASEAGKERTALDGGTAQDWIDEENARIVKLEKDWQRVNRERAAEGLVLFPGPSPLQRASNDKKRLEQLLAKRREEEAAQRRRVQERKEEKEAEVQAMLDDRRQKIASAKRKAGDQVPMWEQRLIKRQKMYMAARNRLQLEIKRKKEEEEKKANAARLKRAVNGPYVPGAEVPFQETYPITTEPTPPPPSVRSRSRSPMSTRSRATTPQGSMAPTTPVSLTWSRWQRPSNLLAFRSPKISPGMRSDSTTSFKSYTATTGTTPERAPTKSPIRRTSLRSLPSTIEDSPQFRRQVPSPVPEKPGSGVVLPGVKNQAELSGMPQQEQLKYVLNHNWPEVEGMPKCAQQFAIENRAASAGLSLEAYLDEEGYANLAEYLQSQLGVAQDAPSELIEKHGDLEPSSLSLIFNTLKDNLIAQARANHVSPEEWMQQLKDKDDPSAFTTVDDWLGEQAVYQAGFVTGNTPEERKLALQGRVLKLSGIGADIERQVREGLKPVERDERGHRFCSL